MLTLDNRFHDWAPAESGYRCSECKRRSKIRHRHRNCPSEAVLISQRIWSRHFMKMMSRPTLADHFLIAFKA